jgi:hypothetical protein
MAPPRQPKIGMERPTAKPAGKPKEKPKEEKPKTSEKPELTHPKSIQDPKNDAEGAPETPEPKPSSKNEGWQTVDNTKLLQSDTQKKEIARIVPLLDKIIMNGKKANANRIEQWQATTFQKLQKFIEDNPSRAKESHTHLKIVAKNVGHASLFDVRKEPTPRKESKQKPQFSPTSLNDEFDENQEFDVESPDADAKDMPNLFYQDDNAEIVEPQDNEPEEENSLPELDNRDGESSTGSSINLLADQKELDGDSSEDTEGAKFVIQLDKTQNSFDDIRAENPTNGTMWLKGATQMAEPGSQETEQDRTKNDKADESLEETVKKAEQRLDTEVREIESILIHTPTVRHHSGSLKEHAFENLAAEAVQEQLNERSADMEAEWEEKEVAWKERRTNMERNWNHVRQAIERESRGALEEQGSIQVSLITHETDNARKEFQAFKLEMSTARQTLQEIQSQNETLQRNTADQTKQMGQLQTIVAEIKRLKQEMRDEATKLDKAIHHTTQLRTNLQEEVTVEAHNTVQGVIDSKMVKVEQAIRDTLQKKGRTIVAHPRQKWQNNSRPAPRTSIRNWKTRRKPLSQQQ